MKQWNNSQEYQSHESAEDTKYDNLVAMKKSDLAEIILEIEDDTEDLKDKLLKSQHDWSDAISQKHAFETLYLVEKKENEKLQEELKEARGY